MGQCYHREPSGIQHCFIQNLNEWQHNDGQCVNIHPVGGFQLADRNVSRGEKESKEGETEKEGEKRKGGAKFMRESQKQRKMKRISCVSWEEGHALS